MDSRYDQMEAAFKEYDRLHPIVWTLFVRFTFQLIDRGFRKHSAVSVMQRIRWETDRPRVDGSTEWKINNNHIPFYARKFMDTYPINRGFFRIREQISRNAPPVNLPPLGPEDYPESDV